MLSKSLIYIILTILCAFALSLTLGWILIPMLRRLKAGQEIREVGPNWHATKAGTPTMGGLTFIGASFLCLVFGIGYMKEGDFSALYVLVLSLCFGLIGFLDDFFKVRYHRNLGLTAIQKAMLQLAVSALFLYILFRVGLLTCDLYLPFVGKTIYVHPMVYMVFAMFVMVGCVNAVNLTDGIDGLATGVTIPVMAFFTVVAIAAGRMNPGPVPGGSVGRPGSLPHLQFPSGQGVYGRHRLPVPGRRGVRPGLCIGCAPGAHPGGVCLHCGDPVRYHSGGLFQADPRQAGLQNGAHSPSL